MSDNPRTDDSLPLSLALRRNQLCNRFKAAWQAAGAIRSRTPEGTAGFSAEGSERTQKSPAVIGSPPLRVHKAW